MAIPIVIPKEGQSMEIALITKWNVKKGDRVDFGDVICEVESEKASFDIESPKSGILLDIFFEAGKEAPVLTTIAVIGNEGDSYDHLRPKLSIDGISSNDKSAGNISETDGTNPAIHAESTTDESDFLNIKSVEVSPRAKKLASDKGIPLSLLINSKTSEGPITEKDVIKYASDNQPFTPAAKEYINRMDIIPPKSGSGIGGRITLNDMLFQKISSETVETPLTGIRKVISDRMLTSVQTTAQFTLNYYADATALLALRARMKDSPLSLSNVTINDIMLYVTAKALADYKELNAHFANGSLTSLEQVNLGCAVDVPGGLMVPVIKDADKMSIKQISDTVKYLALACREGRIKPQEMKDGTFTVTNLGFFGVESFTPILNLPEVGILGVGAIQPRPVRKNGAIEFVDHIALSLTVNHQVIDGAVGARFLELLGKYLKDVGLLMAT